MAQITPEDLLDAMRKMTGEQVHEFNRIQCEAMSAEQWLDVQKIFFVKPSAKQRWEHGAWCQEQGACTEEKHIIQTVTFSDGTSTTSSSVQKNDYGKVIDL